MYTIKDKKQRRSFTINSENDKILEKFKNKSKVVNYALNMFFEREKKIKKKKINLWKYVQKFTIDGDIGDDVKNITRDLISEKYM